MLNVKQGRIKYHILILRYDLTWVWNSFSRAIVKRSTLPHVSLCVMPVRLNVLYTYIYGSARGDMVIFNFGLIPLEKVCAFIFLQLLIFYKYGFAIKLP